jgi:hypothetical protein
MTTIVEGTGTCRPEPAAHSAIHELVRTGRDGGLLHRRPPTALLLKCTVRPHLIPADAASFITAELYVLVKGQIDT